jgi:hypothetical protein
LAELLAERTSPELLYLEAKFASLVSYGLSMKLFEEVLPIGAEINASTIRNHTLAVAEKLESELGDEQVFFIEGCERDWEELWLFGNCRKCPKMLWSWSAVKVVAG